MFIPIRTDYQMTRTPWVNYFLVAANVLLFVTGHNGQDPNNAAANALMLHPGSPEVFQFFTALFLHASWLHLIGNMIFLWVFGNAMNDRLGHVGYLAFYLAGGVLAGIGYILMGGTAPVLGASGAISAVAGAYLVLLPRARVTVLALLFFMIMPLEISSLWFLLFQFVFNLVLAMTDQAGSAGGQVAYWAHNTGYVFGIGLSAALLALRVLPRDAFDLLNLLHASRRRQRFRRMVSGGYDPFAGVAAPHGAGPSRVVSHTVTAAPLEGAALREAQVRARIGESLERHDVAAATVEYLQLVQIADNAVLPRQQQLDVANQLMASERYPQAADAYERFLKHYGDYEHICDIYLMLGLLYGRYLHQHDRARQNLTRAIETLHDPRKIELAQSVLGSLR